MNTFPAPDPANVVLKSSYAIKVFGVGGAGCNAVSQLASTPLPGVTYTVMNTDAPALAQSSVPAKLILGARSTRGLGAGGDPERGRAAAEEETEQLRTLCAGADLVFIVAGMGGGTGTGASPVVARIARETGALVLGIVMLPFDCEGTRRQRQALAGLHELTESADGVISLPNQKLFQLIDDKTSLLEAFQITNSLVAQAIQGLWRLLSRPGLINVDFADLCSVTQGRHAESALASAEAQGENRRAEVMEKLLGHPLIDGGQALADAAGILVCVAGGPDLTMTEVNWVMEQIGRHAEHAQITMGATVMEELEGKLTVLLVVSRRQPGAERATRPETADNNNADRSELAAQLIGSGPVPRPPSRFVAPPPPATPEKTEKLLSQQAGANGRARKNGRMRQAQLPLEIISKGRFEKSEPTIHHGQDLDVPTYIRRGVALN